MVAPESYYMVSLEAEMQRFPKLKVEQIATIQEWIKTQPHLPLIFDVQIAHFLHACYYDTEVAKSTIEHYFMYKNSMREFFSDWDPQKKTIIDYAKNIIFAAFLPRKSQSEAQVLLTRIQDPSPDLYSFDLGVRWILISLTSFLLREGQQEQFKIVYDCADYSFSHVMKNPLSSVKNYLDFGQKACAIRVVEIHFINSSSVVKKMISLIKPFINKQVMKMLNFHTSPDGFFKTIPEDEIPSDYGGVGPSLETLNDENILRVEEMRDALLAHSEQKVDESKRLGKKKKSKTVDEFKKLEID